MSRALAGRLQRVERARRELTPRQTPVVIWVNPGEDVMTAWRRMQGDRPLPDARLVVGVGWTGRMEGKPDAIH